VPTGAEAALEQVLRVTAAAAAEQMVLLPVTHQHQRRAVLVPDLLAEEWVQTMMV
jgi:hypothetical protein